MNTAILLLGGNLGNVAQHFAYASIYIEALSEGEIRKSNLYSSAPWGFTAKENFLNMAIEIKTKLEAQKLLERLQLIEHIFMRQRNEKGYESRTLDIDILFFNHEIYDTETLQIPHPRLHLRNFCLVPLNELVPDYEHPILGKTIRTLLHESSDTGEVKLFIEN